MMETSFTRAMGTRVPIVQAPIANLTTPELVAAVSNAGALGMLSITWRELDELAALLERTRELTDRPFGVNAILEWPMQERIEMCLEAGVAVVSLFWGDPSPFVDRIHRAGAKVMLTVASAQQAEVAVSKGVDIIVAQGWEAGGHVLGTIATTALVPAVVDAVGDVPVVAAGGIADGRGLAAALALGASAAWMGTRFVACEEASAHAFFKRRVLEARETDAEYTGVFNVGWPDAPHRVLRNSTIRAWEEAGRPNSDRPGEGEAVAFLPDGTPALRYSDFEPALGMTGNVEPLAQYAGQSSALVHEVKPAAEIVRDTVEQARAVLARLA